MNHHYRQWLQYFPLIAGVSVGSVILWQLSRPIRLQLPEIAEMSAATTSAPASQRAPLDWSVLTNRRWQQPLFDTAPEQAKVAVTPQTPPPNIELLGTVLSGDQCYALARAAAGAPQLWRVGDKLDGCELVRVDRGLIVVQRGSSQFELRTPWFDKIQEHGG